MNCFPGLDVIVPAIPLGTTPAVLDAFMHTPQPDFDDRTPIEHLAAGGDPALVAGFVGGSRRWLSPRPKPKAATNAARTAHQRNSRHRRLHRHAMEGPPHRGEHVLPWNTLRTYGPLPSMRWDPHPGPQPISAVEGVLYAAADIATASPRSTRQRA